MEEDFGPGRKDVETYKARKTLDMYWQRVHAGGVIGTLQVAHSFLGLRLECAQCHRHPYDVWQQDDLLSFANFFTRVRPAGQGSGAADKVKHAELFAFFQSYQKETGKLAEQVKKMRETDGKQLEAKAKQAKAEADKLEQAITKLEREASQVAAAAKNKPAEADQLTPQAAKLREQAAALRTMTGELKQVSARYERFQKEVGQLERRRNLMGFVGLRVWHSDVHLLSVGAPIASVSSALGTQTSKQLRLLGESAPSEVTADQDPRSLVVAWMRRPDNPYFARAIVNRVWAHYFGRGIVNPPDNLSPFNPATHPELLKELSDGFIKNKYDLKWLHRTILTSRTYQQSVRSNATSRTDTTNYASFYLRRLPAEVLVDALNHATAGGETYPPELYLPQGARAMEVAGSTLSGRNAASVQYAFHIFGRPMRNPDVQCDCERDSTPTIVQTLYLANHPRVRDKIANPNGRLAQIMKAITEDEKRIDEVFLWTLSRLPADGERQTCLKYLKESESPQKGLEDVMWSLLNTREFLLNH